MLNKLQNRKSAQVPVPPSPTQQRIYTKKVHVNKKTIKNIYQQIANILFNDFNIKEEEYEKETSTIDGLGLTHYGFQQFLLKVEGHYEIELSDKDCGTIKDLVEQIEYLTLTKK